MSLPCVARVGTSFTECYPTPSMVILPRTLSIPFKIALELNLEAVISRSLVSPKKTLWSGSKTIKLKLGAEEIPIDLIAISIWGTTKSTKSDEIASYPRFATEARTFFYFTSQLAERFFLSTCKSTWDGQIQLLSVLHHRVLHSHVLRLQQ